MEAASKVHFQAPDGKLLCGVEATDEVASVPMPIGDEPADHKYSFADICGVCWCVWLSIMHEAKR